MVEHPQTFEPRQIDKAGWVNFGSWNAYIFNIFVSEEASL